MTITIPVRTLPALPAAPRGQPLGRLQKVLGARARDRPTALREFLDHLGTGSYHDGKPTTALLREVYVRCTDGNVRDLGLRELREQVD